MHAQHGLTPVLGEVFAAGDTLGSIGTGCLLAASVLIGAAIGAQAGWRALPGAALLVAASISFIDSHIFWPRGVFTMIGIAAGMFLRSIATPQPASHLTARRQASLGWSPVVCGPGSVGQQWVGVQTAAGGPGYPDTRDGRPPWTRRCT